MSANEIKLFPADKYEALTMLYLQNQDLSGLSPEELLDKYNDAHNRIKKGNGSKQKAWL